MKKNELLQNDQEIANELKKFKNTGSNLEIDETPCITNQVSDDILHPVEKYINKYHFVQEYYLSKIGLRFKICFHSLL